MTTRDRRSLCLVSLGLLLAAGGLLRESHLWAFVGLFTVAIAFRYRKKPSSWEYIALLGIGGLILAFAPPRSPLVGAIPLMLSYLLDYLDGRRCKGTPQSASTAIPGLETSLTRPSGDLDPEALPGNVHPVITSTRPPGPPDRR